MGIVGEDIPHPPNHPRGGTGDRFFFSVFLLCDVHPGEPLLACRVPGIYRRLGGVFVLDAVPVLIAPWRKP